MQIRFRRNHPPPERFWRRLDRVAGEINPFLLILAVGLVILYLSCVVALVVRLPLNRVGDSTSCPAATAQLPRHPLPAARSY